MNRGDDGAVLVTGATGQVGYQILNQLSERTRVLHPSRAELDLLSERSIREYLARHHPRLIINAAAYTAVDRAESEPDAAQKVNAIAPGILAGWAFGAGARLVHFSTDYVFDGEKRSPYVESDATFPLNVYGRTKRDGELAVLSANSNAIILRTSWVYGPRGSNFLLTMIRLAESRPELRVVNDQVGAPTSSAAIARAALVIADAQARETSPLRSGIYNLTASGSTTWAGFAEMIFSHMPSGTPKVIPISTAEYPTPARRPLYSVLDNSRVARDFGVTMPSWADQLDDVMGEIQWA